MRGKTTNSESPSKLAGQKGQTDGKWEWRVSLEGRRSLGQLLTGDRASVGPEEWVGFYFVCRACVPVLRLACAKPWTECKAEPSTV